MHKLIAVWAVVSSLSVACTATSELAGTGWELDRMVAGSAIQDESSTYVGTLEVSFVSSTQLWFYDGCNYYSASFQSSSKDHHFEITNRSQESLADCMVFNSATGESTPFMNYPSYDGIFLNASVYELRENELWFYQSNGASMLVLKPASPDIAIFDTFGADTTVAPATVAPEMPTPAK